MPAQNHLSSPSTSLIRLYSSGITSSVSLSLRSVVWAVSFPPTKGKFESVLVLLSASTLAEQLMESPTCRRWDSHVVYESWSCPVGLRLHCNGRPSQSHYVQRRWKKVLKHFGNMPRTPYQHSHGQKHIRSIWEPACFHGIFISLSVFMVVKSDRSIPVEEILWQNRSCTARHPVVRASCYRIEK
jgi:hypothetical protein